MPLNHEDLDGIQSSVRKGVFDGVLAILFAPFFLLLFLGLFAIFWNLPAQLIQAPIFILPAAIVIWLAYRAYRRTPPERR